MNRPIIVLLIFIFYYKYQKLFIIYEQNSFVFNMKSYLLFCQNVSMEQARGLFYICDSGVAGCQSQHQCHFLQMSSISKAYCMGK